MRVSVDVHSAAKVAIHFEEAPRNGALLLAIFDAMSDRARFLIIRFSSIGDIVLTTPVIRALREQIQPTPEIHFLTKRAYGSVLAHNPHIDHIHTIEQSTAELSDTLRAINFDYVVDLHSNLRSRMVKKRLKALDFTVNKQNWDKWLLVRFGGGKPIRHIVDRYLETLRPFGLEDDGRGLEYHIPPEAETEVNNLVQLPSVFIAIALGATHAGKRMSSALIVNIARGLDHPVVLLGGEADREVGSSIASAVQGSIDLSGKLSLHGSAEVIRRSTQLLTGDTGLMHIGAALGKKIVSVWGCTDPLLGMSPYRADAQSVVITPEGRSKRPCSKLGDRCKYGDDQRCIDAIDPEAVLIALKQA